MSRYKCLFSYYGSKSKLAHLYPPPSHDTIIEPFAGGASYSLRYHERDVWINELDPITHELWRFLLSPNALDLIERYVPDKVEAGQRVSEFDLPDGVPGLLYLMRSEANQGTMGGRGNHVQVTSMAVKCWHRLKPRLLHFVPKIAHWRLTNLDFLKINSGSATWFVDPPYANNAGNRYRTSFNRFDELTTWCEMLRGQVIVCENAGAEWLPFESLAERRGVHSRYQKSNAMEVVYIRDDQSC
jgi:site-specific DNA-adenine methylase